jgi:hypothetical protein
MPYRNLTVDDTLITAREELMAMAARGSERVARLRAKSMAAAQKHQAVQKRKEARKNARQQRVAQRAYLRRMVRSTSRLGLVLSPSFSMYWYGFSTFLVPGGLTALLLYLVMPQLSGWSLLYGFAVWALAPFFVMPFALTVCPKELEREKGFVEALPFGVHGYLEALGCDNERKELTMTLCFRRNTPDWTLVRDLLVAHELLKASTERDRDQGREEGDRQLTFSVPTPKWYHLHHDNHGLCRWMHRFVPVAEQLHRVFPIEQLVVSRR